MKKTLSRKSVGKLPLTFRKEEEDMESLDFSSPPFCGERAAGEEEKEVQERGKCTLSPKYNNNKPQVGRARGSKKRNENVWV